MSFPENVEEKETENSASHCTVLSKNHCGQLEYLVPFPSLLRGEKPGDVWRLVLLSTT